MTLTASEVASLRSALGCWEWAEYISTGVVFVGCVGECFAEFTRFPATEKKKRKLARLSLILVIAGIAGELLATVRTSQLSGLVIANIEEQAGDAKTSADKAAQAADRANSSARQANIEAKVAKERAEDVGKQAAELRKQNLELAQKLATIEKGSFPRHLRQKEFAEKLKLFKSFPVLVETISDFEAERTAVLINTGIGMAGWQVNPVRVRTDSAIIEDFFFPGVMVEMNCGNEPGLDLLNSSFEERKRSFELFKACTDATESLLGGLRENGIEARGPRYGNMPHNTIRVRVALKPVPGQPPENLFVTH